MRVTVRMFATVRELSGVGEEVLEIGEGATVGDLFSALADRHPNLKEISSAGKIRILAARNGRFCGWEEELTDGDEVAFFPPVAGGGRVSVGEEIPRLEDVAISLGSSSRDVGAIALFVGRVREHSGDFQVREMLYESYGEMAVREMEDIVSEAEERWGLMAAEAHHRVGILRPGDEVMIVGVASEHRGEAFDALRWIVDRIKERVPIWKKEISPSGEGRWVSGEVEEGKGAE